MRKLRAYGLWAKANYDLWNWLYIILYIFLEQTELFGSNLCHFNLE